MPRETPEGADRSGGEEGRQLLTMEEETRACGVDDAAGGREESGKNGSGTNSRPPS